MEETESTPTETVLLRKSDFAALQQAANDAMEDVHALATVLGFDLDACLLEQPGMTPHSVFTDVLLPQVAKLQVTQGMVDGAATEIRAKAERFGNKTIDVQGVKGLKVGQRLPPEAFRRG